MGKKYTILLVIAALLLAAAVTVFFFNNGSGRRQNDPPTAPITSTLPPDTTAAPAGGETSAEASGGAAELPGAGEIVLPPEELPDTAQAAGSDTAGGSSNGSVTGAGASGGSPADNSGTSGGPADAAGSEPAGEAALPADEDQSAYGDEALATEDAGGRGPVGLELPADDFGDDAPDEPDSAAPEAGEETGSRAAADGGRDVIATVTLP